MYRVKIIFFISFLGILNCSAQVPFSTPDNIGAGNCLRFDPGGNYVSVANIPAYDFGTGSFTIEFWVKFNDVSLPDGIISSWTAGQCATRGWGMLTEGDGRMYFDFGDGSSACGHNIISTGAILSNDEWYHVAGVRNGNNVTIFINGISSGTGTTSMNLTAGRAIMFGTRYINVPASLTLDGDIDEVRLWNDARTEDEIRNNMCLSVEQNEPNLIGYWSFDEGVDNTCSATADVCDQTTNNNHGTKL